MEHLIVKAKTVNKRFAECLNRKDFTKQYTYEKFLKNIYMELKASVSKNARIVNPVPSP